MHLCHEELYALLMLLPGLGWAAWHIRRLVRAARLSALRARYARWERRRLVSAARRRNALRTTRP